MASGWYCFGLNPTYADIIQHYPAYVRETAPLTQKLIQLAPTLSGRLVSLQQLAAINHELHLLQTNYRWERGEETLFSAQLIQTALAALDDAVQFWRDGNELRYLIGENEQYMPFNQAYIQRRLKRVLDCIDDLKTLQQLRDTLDQPTVRYQIRPEFKDTRLPASAAPNVVPDPSLLPSNPMITPRVKTPSPYDRVK
jgi:hypothetical protein